ncbi:MAG: hypothetical protein NTY33_00315 [Candidatus Moranbacteria bacterium]|nr:hypothetical protein [Candidatus Moranbacteria bacterium]
MSAAKLKPPLIFATILVLLGGFFVFPKNASAAPGIFKQINFQGKMVATDGTNVTNASHTFLFCIYTTGSPVTACTVGSLGSAVWKESKSITTVDGIFQTNLGDTDTTLGTAVDFNSDNIYLGINFDSNGQMTPLVQFTASPYAFNSDKLEGKTWEAPGTIGSGTPNTAAFTTLNSSGITQLATTAGSTFSAGNTTGAATIVSGGTSSWANTSGNLTISTTSSGTLAITSAGALNLSAASASTVALANVANALNFDSNTFSIDALNNRVGVGIIAPTALLSLGAATTSNASLNLAAGTAPTGGNLYNGDLWYETGHLYFRDTTTKDLLAVGGHTQNTDTGTNQVTFIVGNTSDAATTNLTLQFGSTNAKALYYDGASTDNFKLNDDLDITGGLTTTSTINLQTISATASFTGTVAVTTSITDPLLIGSSAVSGTLTLQSTSNGTKGKILFGTSAYDEVNNRLAIGQASASYKTDILTSTGSDRGINVLNNATSGTNYGVYSAAIPSSGAPTTNYGGYFGASGATTNYGLQIAGPAGAVTSNYGLNITAPSGATHNSALTLGSVVTTGGTWAIYSNMANNSYFAGNIGINVQPGAANRLDIATATANDRGINIAHTATTGTNYGIYSSVTGATANSNVGGYFNVTSSTTGYGLQVATMNSATSTGLDIAQLTGATANYGINLSGGINSAGTNTGINVGTLTGAGAATGLNIAQITASGGATTNYGINVNGFSSAAAGTANYGIRIGDIAGGATTSKYGISILSLTATGASTNTGVNIGAITGSTGAAINTGLSIGSISGTATSNTGINVGQITTTGATNSYGINITNMTGTGVMTGAINVAAITNTLSGATATLVNLGGFTNVANATSHTGINLGAISGTTGTAWGMNMSTITGGTTANYGINIGQITGVATGMNKGIVLGGTTGSSGTTSTNTGIEIGAIAGTATNNYGLNILAGITGGSTANYGLNVGAITTTGATDSFGLNLAAMTGSGATSTGLNIMAPTSALAGTTSYGINIASSLATSTSVFGMKITGATGASTNSYGLNLTVPTGATHNTALEIGAAATTSGTWALYSSSTSNSYLAGNIGVGTGMTSPTAFLDVAGFTTGEASLNISPTGGSTVLSAPNVGDVWFENTSTPHLYFRKDGSTTQDLLAAGTGMTNPMTTAGDVIYGGAAGAPQRLGGSSNDGYVLKYNLATNIPYWSTDLTSAGGPTVSLAPASADSAANANPAIFINETSTGNLMQLQKSGIDKFTVANNGGLTVNGSDSSIVKQTSTDFSKTGSTVGLSLDNSNGALSISDTATGGIPNGGKGTITTGGATTSVAVGAGAFSITRADGKYLLIRGGGTGMDVFDSVANTFTAAPTGQVLNSAAGAGATALPRPGGRYRILHGGGTNSTSLIDPMGVAPVGPNIASSAVKGAGTVAYLRPNGRFLITNGGAATTDLYDPVADSFTAGNSGTGGNWVAGTVILPRNDGQALVVVGNSSNTQLYDPNAGTVTGGSPIGAFTVGPTLDGNQAAGTCAINANGSVALRRQDGKYVVLSKVSVWAVYDPVANTITCNASGGPATAIGDGGHAIPLQNGKFLIIVGGNSQNAYIYDPSDDSFTTYGATPLTAVTTGAHSIMRHDGKWQIIVGGGQNTNTYDTALPMSDSNTKYTSEDIYNNSINTNSTLWYRVQMESVYAAARNATTNTAFSTLQFFVQTAHSSDGTQAGCATPLNAAPLNEIRNSGDLIDASVGNDCVRLTVQFNRPLPKRLFDERNVWVGNGLASTRYNYVTPRLYSLKVDNSAVLKRSNFDFTNPNASNPTNPTIPAPLTSTLNATGGACTSGTHTWYVTFVTNGVESQLGTPSTPAITCNGDGNDSVSLSNIPIGPAGTTNRKIYRTPAGNSPDPLLLTTLNSSDTTYTDVSADTSLGAPYSLVTASGPVSTRSETRVETVNGNLVLPYGRLQSTTQIAGSATIPGGYYMGAYSNAHPQLTNAAGAGTTVIARDDKQFLIIEPGGNFADLYDPATETFINQTGAGNIPTTTNAAGVGTGAFSLKRPDGTFLVYLGNLATTTACTVASTATDIYNPNAPSGSRFTNGPCLTAAAGVGSQAILNNDGTYTIIHGNGVKTTSVYNPVTNTMIIGPDTTQNISCGSWAIPMGLPNNNQYKVKIGAAPGAAANATTLNYDANAKVFSAGGGFTNSTGCGSIAFQRPDGYWFITSGENSGASTTTTTILNPINGAQGAGPTLTAGTTANGRGTTVIPRADGTFLLVNGNPVAAGTLATSTIYFPTGGPIVTNLTVPMGVIAQGPPVGPAAAAALPTGALVAGTNLGIGAYYYRYTNVIGGIESLPSAVSAAVTTTSGNQAVTVTLAAAPAGTTTRRVYRTVVGAASTTIEYFVGQVDGTGTTFNDTFADATIVANPAIPYAVAPATAATIASIGAGGSVDIGVHTYKYTFVTNGVESLPAAASATATTSAGNQTVNVAGIIAGPTGTTERRVYRTIASANGLIGSYRLVGIVSGNSTLTFPDTYADSTLGSLIPGGAITATYTGQSDGAISFQRPDGKWVMINGGSTASTPVGIYDAGWYSEGQYLSEMMQVQPLAANSTLEWQKTADPYARFEVRVASTQVALQTTSFKGVDSPGNTINNAGNEIWAQVVINFRRDFPTFCSNLNGVYNSGAGLAYCNRNISLPTVLQYQITNGQDLLSLQTNTYNVLRVTSNGGIYSSQQGGFFAGGADLAENYTSKDELSKGEVVSIDSSDVHNVKRSTMAYQKDVLGIVSTAPGFVAGEYTDGSYPIALVGRVPVNVSTENGMIKAGDRITSASIPGYAMRATVGGRVIGTAMETIDLSKMSACPAGGIGGTDAKCGQIMVFVNLTDYQGMPVETLMSEMDSNGLVLDGGAVADADDPNSPFAKYLPQAKTLDFLKVLQDKQTSYKAVDILVGNVNAINQIISPLIVTDTLIAKHIKADSIEGLEFIQTNVASATSDAAAAVTQTADLGKEVADLKTQLLAMSATPSNVVPLETLKDFEVQGGLKVAGPVEFQGPAMFKALAEFVDKVIFRNNVEFAGQVTFNEDSAGYAIINKGENSVQVQFANEYANVPIINASISVQDIKDEELKSATEDLILATDVKYIITNVTTKGFEIKISSINDWEIPFAWQAASVKDARTSQAQIDKQDPDAIKTEKEKAVDSPKIDVPVATKVTPTQTTLTTSTENTVAPEVETSTDSVVANSAQVSGEAVPVAGQ